MNKEEQLKRLICALYRQDEPEDYTDECMEDMLDNIDFEVLLQAVAHSAKTVYAYLQSACRADVHDNDCRMDVRHQHRSRNAPTAGSCLCGLYHPSHCGMADCQNRRD